MSEKDFTEEELEAAGLDDNLEPIEEAQDAVEGEEEATETSEEDTTEKADEDNTEEDVTEPFAELSDEELLEKAEKTDGTPSDLIKAIA